MRHPAHIEPWLTPTEMFHWLQKAEDPEAYRRRLAISLTQTGKLHAPTVATVLGVSTAAVRLWITQYNRQGPEGLRRQGRGGRRRGLLSEPEENQVVAQAQRISAETGLKPTAILADLVAARTGAPPSRSYCYKLWQRRTRQATAKPFSSGEEAGTLRVRPSEFQRRLRPWRNPE